MLIDTNIWLIAADHCAPRHAEIVELLGTRVWSSPTPVIAESAWLILDRLGTAAHQRFLRLVTAGQLEPIELTTQDWNRCEELCATYADLALDLVDASLIAIAERVGETQIATLNYRDFTVVRPTHTEAFELLPGPT